MYEIIDAHAHIYPDKIASKAAVAIGDFYHIDMDCNGSVAGLLKVGQEGGVSRYLVHSVATTPHQVTSINRFLLEQIKLHPEFIGFMTLHQDLTEDEIASEVDFCIQNGFHGIKLHPDFQKFRIDSPEAHKIYDVVNGRLPILFHTGDKRYDYSNPYQLSSVAKEYPHSYFIGAHFGGYSVWDQAEKYLPGHKNLFVDCSSCFFAMRDEEIRHYIRLFGADRVLFGTDYPMWKVKPEVDRLLSLGLSDDEYEAIFHENAERVYKIGKNALSV